MKKYLFVTVLSISLSFSNCFNAGYNPEMAAWVDLGWMSWLCNILDPLNGNPLCQVLRAGRYTAPGSTAEVCKSCANTSCEPLGNTATSCSVGRPYADQPGGLRAYISVDFFNGFKANVSSGGVCSWEPVKQGTKDAPVKSTFCGFSYVKDQILGTQECVVHKCVDIGTVSVAPVIMGYEAMISDPPIGVNSISPANSEIIYENQTILINFAGSVKSDSISLSGSM